MDICFRDEQHREFYLGCIEQANCNGVPVDVYFKSFVYLCGLCPEIRQHFSDLFDWSPASRGICLDSLEKGWQTGTSRKVTRLAFNLWNGWCRENETDEQASCLYAPDEIFCCGYQEYFFEALRLRFPEYSQCRRDGCFRQAGNPGEVNPIANPWHRNAPGKGMLPVPGAR